MLFCAGYAAPISRGPGGSNELRVINRWPSPQVDMVRVEIDSIDATFDQTKTVPNGERRER